MMKKDCRWIRDHLLEMVEGSMNPEESDQMAGHLRHCPRCANLVRKFQVAWEMMGKPEKVEVSPGFESLLFEKIEELHRKAIRNNKIKGRLLKALQPAALTAGFFLALFLGYHLGNFSKQEPVPMGPDFALEASYQDYSSGDLTILDDYSRGSAADFLLTYKVTPKEDSP